MYHTGMTHLFLGKLAPSQAAGQVVLGKVGRVANPPRRQRRRGHQRRLLAVEHLGLGHFANVLVG